MKNEVSRKRFIKSSAMALFAMQTGVGNLLAAPLSPTKETKSLIDSQENTQHKSISISIFSKHLHWLNYKDMAALTAEMGFDGIDLTVRPDGHVLPENVSRDLPKAVSAVEQFGLKVNSITTAILNADEKYTDDILRTAAQLGIKNYRMGWYSYDDKLAIADNIDTFKNNFQNLAAKNQNWNIRGDYENHTNFFGSAIWDLWLVLKDLDPKYTACQFDIQHASVDGAEAWPINFKLLKDHIGSITIKDFLWKKKGDKWVVENVPLGHGMVNFDRYFSLVKKYQTQLPIFMHFEYALGGAENGAVKLTIPQSEVIKNMRADLRTLKELLKKHELI